MAPRRQAEPESDPKSVKSAEKSGDRLKILIAMRERLAAQLDEAPATVAPQIVAQMRALLAEIDELKPPKKEPDAVDLLARALADRIADASVASSPRARGGRSGKG